MAKLMRDKRPDGTYLVWFKGDNKHLNHWHVAPDGTVLSVKEGGDYKYNRRQIRQHINDVTGFDWNTRWVETDDE